MATVSGVNGVTILDDSYNANPVSMKAALDTLAQLSGHKIAIIGDMAELEASTEAHATLDVSNIDRLILIGYEMQALKNIRPEALWFSNTDKALVWVRSNLKIFSKSDTVLIKGSRSMQLDRIVRAMMNGEDTHAL